MIHSSNRLTGTLVTYGLANAIAEESKNHSKYPQRGVNKSWRCKVNQHRQCTVLACACECHDKELEA